MKWLHVRIRPRVRRLPGGTETRYELPSWTDECKGLQHELLVVKPRQGSHEVEERVESTRIILATYRMAETRCNNDLLEIIARHRWHGCIEACATRAGQIPSYILKLLCA